MDPRLGPLPAGWEEGRTAGGQAFWTKREDGIKTYYDPRRPNPHPDGFGPLEGEGGGLPEGWEVVGKVVDGRVVRSFLDHNTHTATSRDPRN